LKDSHRRARRSHQFGSITVFVTFFKQDPMDTDLEPMTREELIAEVKKLRHGNRPHRDGMKCAGIIQRCGDCCLRTPILFPLSGSGRNSCKAASDIVNRWTSRQAWRRARMNPMKK
jgi:hypothetical protein